MGLQGIAHLGITVTDLSRSKEWYSQVVGWKPEMDGGGEGVSFLNVKAPDGIALELYAPPDESE